MFDFLFFTTKKRRSLERLASELKALRKPTLQQTSRQQLRQQLLTSIKQGKQAEIVPLSFKKLIISLRQEANKVHLDPQATAFLKERVLGLVETYRPQVLSAPYLKTILTSALLLIFVVTTFFAFPFITIPTSYARSTYISELEGNVFIARNQEIVRATPFFLLQEGDTILTRQNSFVTVTFFDDSQSRLSENTRLQIQKLQFKPFNHVASQVELFLEQGRMWGKVVNLVNDESRFIVQTDNATATVIKKASFDLSEEGESTKVRVYDNVVDLHFFETGNNIPSKTVVAGYQAEVLKKDEPIQLQVTTASPLEDKDWVASNLKRDERYSETILQSKQQLLESNDIHDGFQGNSSEYGKQLSSFTNVQVEEARAHFFEVYLDLKKGESLLANGSHKEGIKLIGQFHLALKDFIKELPKLKKVNGDEALVLQQIVEEKVALQLKDLATFMPGDRLYVAKEILQQIELSLADSEVKKAKIRLSHADGKLFEIQHLLQAGQLPLAETMLKNYSDQMAQFVLKIGPENYKEVEDNLVDFVEKQIQQLKILTALEQSFSQDDTPFKDLVKSTRREQLQKLMGSLEELSASVPKELLSQLRDTFDSYLRDSTNDEDIIVPLFNSLVDSEHQLLFVQPQEIPVLNEIGVVTIITEGNPTADAQDVPEIQQASQQALAVTQELVVTQEQTQQASQELLVTQEQTQQASQDLIVTQEQTQQASQELVITPDQTQVLQ